MEEWMSLRAYARHRKVALSAVQKAIESRRVTAIREKHGRITGIEKNQADEQWAANTDAVEAARNGKFVTGPAELKLTPPTGSALPDKPTAPEPTGDQGNFLAARVREAELRGELLELDKFERIGELLPRAVVRQEFSEFFSQLKSAVFRIPDRKAQAIAAETDPVRVHRVLSDELRAVFDEFSSQLIAPPAAMADHAGVAGEREEVLP